MNHGKAILPRKPAGRRGYFPALAERLSNDVTASALLQRPILPGARNVESLKSMTRQSARLIATLHTAGVPAIGSITTAVP